MRLYRSCQTPTFGHLVTSDAPQAAHDLRMYETTGIWAKAYRDLHPWQDLLIHL